MCDGVPHEFGRLAEKDKSQEQFFGSSFQNRRSLSYHKPYHSIASWAYVTLCYEIVANSEVNRRLLTAQKDAIDEYIVRCRCQFTGFEKTRIIFFRSLSRSHVAGRGTKNSRYIFAVIMQATIASLISSIRSRVSQFIIHVNEWFFFYGQHIASILFSFLICSNGCRYDYWPRIMIIHISHTFETIRLHCDCKSAKAGKHYFH